MEYQIHHLSLIEPPAQQPFFEEEVKRKIGPINKIVTHYPKNLLLEIFIKKEGGYQYVVTASLSMMDKVLAVEERGAKSVMVVNNVLDKLKSLIKKQVPIERKEYTYSRKSRVHELSEKVKLLIEDHIKKEDAASFTEYIRKILPEIEKHIKKEIRRKPVLLRLINKDIVQQDVIIKNVYLDLFSHFKNNPDELEKLILWAFSLSHKKIKELAEKYSNQYKQALGEEELNKKELSNMQERLTGHTEPMSGPAEEFDEKVMADEYNLQEILSDAGALEPMISKAKPDGRNMNIQKLLEEFPEQHQSTFELYYLYRFNVDDIARIKNLKEAEIEKKLSDIRTRLLRLVMAHI